MSKLIPQTTGLQRVQPRFRLKRHQAGTAASPLRVVADFGRNPGMLGMQCFVPAGLAAGAPLVVVLHGCQQDPAGYDAGTGWSALAARHGFALLYPAQQTGNNPLNCFKWYEPSATARQGGEVESILAMIEYMVAREGVDPRRVFVTGLSAGGAMAGSLLASAPDAFAAGAIIAGLPHGVAGSVNEALQVMRRPPALTATAWGDKVRAAHPHHGTRPRVSIWHGTADGTVHYANAEAQLVQWADVLGVVLAHGETETTSTHARRIWRDEAGLPMLELWSVTGMAHGAPIAPLAAEQAHRLGQPAPFILDTDLSSTWHIAKGWGLLETPARQDRVAPTPEQPRPASGIGAIIEKALRDAGLR